MQQFRCMALATVAYLAIGSHATSLQQRGPGAILGHLRIATDSDTPWKAAMQDSISNFALPASTNPHGPRGQVLVTGKGDKGDKGKKMDQPVSVQVPENDMTRFMGTLSTGCSQRYEQMLHGKGGDLHTFGAGGSKKDSASCKKLNGALCATQAHIIHERKHSASGRKMESTTDVSGNSCLPTECMSKADLSGLTTFMHTQAKNIIPGAEHRVELLVDCTQSGGTTAAMGVKSGSASLVPAALTIGLAMLIARM